MARKSKTAEDSQAEAVEVAKPRVRKQYVYRIIAQRTPDGPLAVLGTQDTVGKARKQYAALYEMLRQIYAASWIERCVGVPLVPAVKNAEVQSNGQG